MFPSTTLPPLVPLALGLLLAIPAQAQFSASSVAGGTSLGPHVRSDQVLVVDPSGGGHFTDLQAAISAAPSGALLLLKPGDYGAALVAGKSLRIESDVPGSARLTGLFTIRDLGPRQDVSIGGLFFVEGFEVDGCQGDVALANCTAIDDGAPSNLAPGIGFFNFPDCGSGGTRHQVRSSASVTFVDCSFEGRDGVVVWAADGTPGEHALVVTDSRVAVYGGSLIGGDGSDAPGNHGAYAGSGGDGIQAHGSGSRVAVCDVTQIGGTGGIDMEFFFYNGCPGEPFRTYEGAVVESCASDHVIFEIGSLAHTGDLPTYTITAPPGTDLFLMAAPRRAWREFVAEEGILHLGGGLQLFPLGTMPSGGTLTRPFPAPRPAWLAGFGSVELQLYARVAGQDRYSEPRALQVVAPSL